MRLLMKGIFTVSISALTSAFAQAQSQLPVLDPDFSHITFEAAASWEFPIGIGQSQDGSIYIAGEESLTKLDANGHKIWSKLYGERTYSWNGIGVDNEGNAYIAATNFKTWEFLVLKYNSQGEVIKTHKLPQAFKSPLGIVFDRKLTRLYVLGYDDQNDVNFDAIETYSNGRAFYVGRYNIGRQHSSEVLLSMADGLILSGMPLIFRVRGHFLLVIGKCGNNYIIADPAGGRERLYNPDDLTEREFEGLRVFGAA